MGLTLYAARGEGARRRALPAVLACVLLAGVALLATALTGDPKPTAPQTADLAVLRGRGDADAVADAHRMLGSARYAYQLDRAHRVGSDHGSERLLAVPERTWDGDENGEGICYAFFDLADVAAGSAGGCADPERFNREGLVGISIVGSAVTVVGLVPDGTRDLRLRMDDGSELPIRARRGGLIVPLRGRAGRAIVFEAPSGETRTVPIGTAVR